MQIYPNLKYRSTIDVAEKSDIEESRNIIMSGLQTLDTSQRRQYRDHLRNVRRISLIGALVLAILALIMVIVASSNQTKTNTMLDQYYENLREQGVDTQNLIKDNREILEEMNERMKRIENYIIAESERENSPAGDGAGDSAAGNDEENDIHPLETGTESDEHGSGDGPLPSTEESNPTDSGDALETPARTISADLYALLTPSGLSPDQFNDIIRTTYSNKWHKDPGAFGNLGATLSSIEDQYDFNALYILGIAGLESGYGTSSRYLKTNDAYGQIGMSFDSLDASTMNLAKNLRHNYIDQGRTDLLSISEKYCPPHFVDGKWAKDVQWITNQYIKVALSMGY